MTCSVTPFCGTHCSTTLTPYTQQQQEIHDDHHTYETNLRVSGDSAARSNLAMTVEQVRGVLATQYPEIATAALTGPETVGDKCVYRFERAIGTKG